VTDGFGPRAGRSPRRAVAAAAVLGAHLLVLLAIWQMKAATSAQLRETTREITLRLLPLPAEPRARQPLDRKFERQLTEALRPRERVDRVPAPAPPRITLLPPPSDAGARTPLPGSGAVGLDGTVAAAAPGLAASGPHGLNLTPSRDVLRGALANPATSDPRSNSPVPTFEERITMGLDPDACLLTERLPDGTIRRRMSKYRRVQSTMSAVHAQGQGSARICE